MMLIMNMNATLLQYSLIFTLFLTLKCYFNINFLYLIAGNYCILITEEPRRETEKRGDYKLKFSNMSLM